ncbi:MAG: YihY/virulence factor BrkB family protein [Vicinamibacterales bacterium]
MLSAFRVPLSWGQLFRRTFNEVLADDVFNLAAQQAYYFFFALFPALLALISIASFFPVQNLIDEITKMLSRVAPGDVIAIVRDQILKISQGNAGGVLTFAFVLTLWSSSSAVVSMCGTLNAAYDLTEGRPWWKVRLTAIGLTVGLALFILVSMTLVIAGPTLAEKVAEALQLGPVFEWTWKIVQWPVVLLLIATAFAMVYYFAPDAQQEWVWITPGSVLATLLWVLSSLGFKYYVANFANYNETYGTIGGVMVLLLWFYVSGIAMLIGAELNAEIEHASPYGKDPGERVPGEKKKIGLAAQRAYEERRAHGEADVPPFPDDVNCDVDEGPTRETVRPSELLIGAAALLPAALKLGMDVRKRVRIDKDKDDRAA